MNQIPPDAIVLTLPQLMAKLQIKKTFAYRLVEEGHIAAKKIGGRWRITPEALAAYLSAPSKARKCDQIL